MATFIRRAAVGAFVLVGLLGVQNAAHAQFSFGWTRYGYNPSNPYVAQQQYLANLQAGRLAIASGQAVPAWLPYVAPYASPYYGSYGYNNYYNGYAAPYYNPYLYGGYGYGTYSVNPYLSSYGYSLYGR